MRYFYLFTLAFSLLAGHATYAQRGNTSSYQISYNYVYDDPYSFKKFKMHLDILGLDWTMGNFPLHAGLQININPHPRFTMEALFRGSYYDFRFFEAKKSDSKMSDNKLLPFMYAEGVLEWNAMDKLRRRNLRFNLTQLTIDYYWQYTEYAYIPISYRRFFSFRAGGQYYMMPVEGSSKVPLTVEGTSTNYQDNYYTMASSYAVFGGISWGRKARTSIKIRDYGIRRVVQQNQFMVDVLYGFPSIADLQIGGNEYKIETPKPRNLGWRMGWQWNNYNMHQRFEFGQRPGIHKGHFFMMYTLGFTIMGREKE